MLYVFFMSNTKDPSPQAQWEAERKAEGWRYVKVLLPPEQLSAIDAKSKSRQAFAREAIERAIKGKPQ